MSTSSTPLHYPPPKLPFELLSICYGHLHPDPLGEVWPSQAWFGGGSNSLQYFDAFSLAHPVLTGSTFAEVARSYKRIMQRGERGTEFGLMLTGQGMAPHLGMTEDLHQLIHRLNQTERKDEALSTFLSSPGSMERIWQVPDVLATATHQKFGKTEAQTQAQSILLTRLGSLLSDMETTPSVKHLVFRTNNEAYLTSAPGCCRDFFVHPSFWSTRVDLMKNLAKRPDIQVHWQPSVPPGEIWTVTLAHAEVPSALRLYSSTKVELVFSDEHQVDIFPHDLDSTLEWFITAGENFDWKYCDEFGTDIPPATEGRERLINIHIGGDYKARMELLSAWKDAACKVHTGLSSRGQYKVGLFDGYRPIFKDGRFVEGIDQISQDGGSHEAE